MTNSNKKRKLLGRIFGLFEGKKKYQNLFEKLHKIALYGMNISSVADLEKSGERQALNTIYKKLRNQNELLLFDVGANVGNYTKLLKDIFPANSKIFCFEPSKESFKKLKANLRDTQNTFLFNFGLGEKETELTLYSDYSSSSLASVYHRKLNHHNIDFSYSEKIKIRTLNNFCSEEGIKHINLLKLDVEGHELSVLKGAKEFINNNKIDYIQFEFGGTQIDSRVFFQDFYYLLKDKYSIYRVLKDGLYKIEGYSEINEIFLASIFIAERKEMN